MARIANSPMHRLNMNRDAAMALVARIKAGLLDVLDRASPG
jgi:hypothetical protein